MTLRLMQGAFLEGANTEACVIVNKREVVEVIVGGMRKGERGMTVVGDCAAVHVKLEERCWRMCTRGMTSPLLSSPQPGLDDDENENEKECQVEVEVQRRRITTTTTTISTASRKQLRCANRVFSSSLQFLLIN